MTDTLSLKMKPSAAVLMALALITTTFAGVSFADPSTGPGATNPSASIDYDIPELILDYDDGGNDDGSLTGYFFLYDDGEPGSEQLLYEGIFTLDETNDNNSWNTHSGSFNLTDFVEQNANYVDGALHNIEANVYFQNMTYIGSDWVEFCMENGSVCLDESEKDDDLDGIMNDVDTCPDTPVGEQVDSFGCSESQKDDDGDGVSNNLDLCPYTQQLETVDADGCSDEDLEQMKFDDADADSDGGVNGSELIDYVNSLRAEKNESAMNEEEESELLEQMARPDFNWDEDVGVLNFEEFLEFYYLFILTFYEISYEDEDNRIFQIQIIDQEDYGYTFISIVDINQNEVYNTTFNTTLWSFNLDENNLNDAFYILVLVVYNEMGYLLYSSNENIGDVELGFAEIEFERIDSNSDSVISWEEYSSMLQEEADIDSGLTDLELFDIADINSDGAVNATELIELFAGEESEVLIMMADYDIGWESMDGGESEDAGDGMLEFNEFLAFYNGLTTIDNATLNLFMNMFLSQDIDGDGGLDMDEFLAFIELMDNEGDDHGDDGGDDDDDIEFMMMMLDTDGDGNISLSEMTVMSDETMSVTFFTNVFNHNDFNGDGMLDLVELEMFMAHMDEMDSEVCQYVKTGDLLKEDGWLMDDYDYEIEVMAGDTAAFDGEYCYQEDGPMSGDFMIFMADTDSDGKISLAEVIALFNGMNAEEPLSDIEEEWMSIAFMMSDGDGDELLDEDEFMDFYYQLDSDDHDGNDDHDEHDDHGGEGEESHEDMLRFYDVDVWFEQWNDQSMELVIVELAVLDNQEEIDRMVMMADAEYGNNDSVLDQAEVDMLMGLYALSLNPDDMAEGLTLDGQNGTAVDFWVEVDGLLEGDDVVFLRLATVIQFPTTAYDTSTTHTFVVHDNGHEETCPENHHMMNGECMPDDMMNSDNHSMENSMDCDDELGIWIHNSETWSIGSAVDSEGVLEFTYDETNNMWYAKDDGCSHIGTITFILDKTENGSLPDAQDEDWTWEEEEMNMFPICAWTFSANFADNTSVTDEWMDEAPESGDYEIVLVDDAAYEIFVSCWDPEGGKMVVDITSALGNSSNTSIGEAMGHIAFKLPAGTSGNVTFDVTWTDGHHTESGTLTVYATGDGDLDLSEIDVEDASGVLPGFTAGLGVLAMLGAAMLGGRRNNA